MTGILRKRTRMWPRKIFYRMRSRLVLSLGTNIEPRTYYLKRAVRLLNGKFKFVKLSSLYETSPVDETDQSMFYNIAAVYETGIKDPLDVLKVTQSIERRIGRHKDANRPKGPRIIDIDIIFFDDIEIKSEKLTIPHERFFYRKFVLVPILEVLENGSAYLEKYDIKKQLNCITGQTITKIGDL